MKWYHVGLQNLSRGFDSCHPCQNMWKKHSSKLLLDHPRLQVSEDTVELPDGSLTDYLVYSGGGNGITIIAQDKDGKILLSKEYSYPVGKIIWQFPGGGIFPTETPEQGAIRELREEGKLLPHKVTLIGSYLTNNRRSSNRMFVCVAEDLESSPLEGDKEESIENFWLEESEIDNLIKIGEIENSHLLASWSLYKLR